MPDYEKTTGERLHKLEDQVAQILSMLARRPALNLIKSGDLTVAAPGGIKSDDFDGDLATLTAGTKGWALGGPELAAIFNVLVLRDRIIGNDALANPVEFDQNGGFVDGIAFTTTPHTPFITTTLTVPAGFTRALLICNALAGGLNPSSAPDNLYCEVEVAGIGGSAFVPQGVPAGLSVIVPEFYNVGASGLTPGSTISIIGKAWTTVGTWPTSSQNFVTVNAVGIFLR